MQISLFAKYALGLAVLGSTTSPIVARSPITPQQPSGPYCHIQGLAVSTPEDWQEHFELAHLDTASTLVSDDCILIDSIPNERSHRSWIGHQVESDAVVSLTASLWVQAASEEFFIPQGGSILVFEIVEGNASLPSNRRPTRLQVFVTRDGIYGRLELKTLVFEDDGNERALPAIPIDLNPGLDILVELTLPTPFAEGSVNLTLGEGPATGLGALNIVRLSQPILRFGVLEVGGGVVGPFAFRPSFHRQRYFP